MAILSVDLALRRWSDLGVVILSGDSAPEHVHPIRCDILPLSDPGSHADQLEPRRENPGQRAHPGLPVDPHVLAGRLNHLCATRDIRIIMLDGPQAWKSRANGLEHSRVSERALNCAAKTGLPGLVKPITYRRFAEFCIDVYDGLCRRGWRRFETLDKPATPHDRILIESYPHAAWKALGLKPLPSKRRAGICDLADAYAALNAVLPFTTNRPPNHDQLQAIVGGMAGLDIERNSMSAVKIIGTPPRREDGHWREGFIVLPQIANASRKLNWLD